MPGLGGPGQQACILVDHERGGRLSTFDRVGVGLVSILGTCIGLMMSLASDIRVTPAVALLFPGLLVGVVGAQLFGIAGRCPGLWCVERCGVWIPAVRLVSAGGSFAMENSNLVCCRRECLGASWRSAVGCRASGSYGCKA
jgi:hypothetical protein